MTENLTGADLEQLDALAQAFTTAGTEIAARADVLRSKIDAAVQAFLGSLDTLTSETTTLTASIDGEMAAVSGEAGGVGWTGNNRAAFDGDMAAYKSAMTTATSAINGDITELRSAVTTNFTPVLGEFATALQTASDGVGTNTSVLQQAVATQRTNLDSAANVGWTSA